MSSLGAKGDGRTDDRAAIQAAIDNAAAGGGDVELPAGNFLISRAGNQPYGLKVPSGVRLHGAGQDKTVLLQAPGTDGGARLVFATGKGITIEDLTLEGNKQAQTPSEHRHGLVAMATEGLRLQRVTAKNFTGDGFYLYTEANRSTLYDVLSTGNGRNGVTMGGKLDGTVLLGSRFIGNRAQQIDSEPWGPAVVSNTWVIGNLIDCGGATNNYVLTVSGTETVTRGHDWTVIGNQINGGVFVVWAEHVVIAGNTGENKSSKPSVTVYRTSSDVTILGNHFTQAGARVAVIAVLGSAGGGPENVVIAENTLETASERGFGVQAAGARSVVIRDNVLRGAGRPSPGFSGIALRATNPTKDFESAVVAGNRISNFGSHGIHIMGNGAARLLSVDITNNTFEESSSEPSMTAGISLDADGLGAAKQISVIDNKYVGVTTEISTYPKTVPVLVGGVRGKGGVYRVAGTPEGVLPEAEGATAVVHDPDGVETVFIKRSGRGSKTGWALR